MNFEKYGNKLINLLTKLERCLEPNTQIGGSDGSPGTPVGDVDKSTEYLKILSYSVNHISILVHLDKKNLGDLEDPQINYKLGETVNQEYSIEQQLRLGCDNKGHMYDFSMVLTFDFSKKTDVLSSK
jgi:hypothetical protein